MSATPSAAPDVRAAYQYCEQVTKTQARNFSYGISLLPGDKRRALSAVYAFARRVDDIGDGSLPPADKLAALAVARRQILALGGSPEAPAAPRADLPQAPPAAPAAAADPVQAELAQAELAQAGEPALRADPVLVALADAASRFAIPLVAFGELIEGCEADVRGTAYRTFGDLEHYCRCVAGSIGRLSLGVFGAADPRAAAPLADDLGVALQLTNILRDVREDLGNGRVYLPADDLAQFGCTLAPGTPPWSGELWSGAASADQAARLEQVIRFEADRAQSWYAAGLALMPMLDRRSAACAGAMAGIYLRLLEHIAAAPGRVLQGRMSLPGREKLLVAVRCLAGQTPRPARAAGPARPVTGGAR